MAEKKHLDQFLTILCIYGSSYGNTRKCRKPGRKQKGGQRTEVHASIHARLGVLQQILLLCTELEESNQNVLASAISVSALAGRLQAGCSVVYRATFV